MVLENKESFTVGDLISSILKNKIIYEIDAPSVYFGYDSIGHSFFKNKNLQRRIESPKREYLRIIHAFLFCANIKTVNPKSIWVKCKFGESRKIIQVLEIGSFGSHTTKRKCEKFFENMEDFNFGHFQIVKNPAFFCYEKDIESLTEEIDLNTQIDDLEKDEKKKFFYNLENFLLLNSKSKLEEWNVTDCKSFLVKTPIRNLKIFRSR